MLLQIPDVLTAEQVRFCRSKLEKMEWVDGRITAGHQSGQVKENQQVPSGTPEVRELENLIITSLQRNPMFMAAALPLKVFPPLFNRYQQGHSFGTHVDNAIRQIEGTSHRVRTDISATLFLSEPDEYEGGELLVEDTYGVHNVKLHSGHIVLYPASSLHHVRPVTLGARLASFFWIQSMVRDDGERTLLFDLDLAIQRLNEDSPNHPTSVQLTGIYHNLLRRWADV